MSSLSPVRIRDGSTDPQLPAPTATTVGDDHIRRADAAGEHVSVHDLLDLTWHYQCVVSPSFSAAALSTALISTSRNANIDQQHSVNYEADFRSPSSSSSAIRTASPMDQHPNIRKLKLKVNNDLMGRDRHFDLLRRGVQQESLPAACPWPSLQAPEAVMAPLLHYKGVSAYAANSHDNKHDEDNRGYVSLASLVMDGRNGASSEIASPIASQSPHHNYIELALDLFNFKKQSKSRSRTSTFTSRTCRDDERVSTRRINPAADPTRIGSYLVPHG